MRYIIIGAGAVGGSIGGRLAEAEQDVVLVARGAHHEALRDHGLRLVTPDGTRVHKLPVVERPEELDLSPDDVLLLSVKTQDSTAALDAWAAQPVAGGGTAGELLPLVCAQNGVESERLALRRFRRVYAMCVWLPATYVDPGEIIAGGTPYTGMLHIGRYPAGADETARRIAAGLEQGKLLSPVAPDAMRWKYAKLLANLANAIEALTGPVSGDGAREILRRALAEGRSVLTAAGIGFASQEEAAEVRGDKVTLDPSGRGGGSSWQSLSRGTGTIETDYLNGEIALLGRLHDVPTPVNDTLQRVAGAFAREHRPAGSMTVAELTALVDGRRD
ncbi:ketopantoate reductase family protein [Streptomyces sp. AK02-01A]|uniref:ketopantoate reductase family protein n=1 Tax=Streptomyces sp. AK02-01A TaxID=3028648 RepID=UPI0029A857D5|nr:2-dehydropantoate 2-reductase N-terminal domain-containing protein [Streptomyces sp. AK02-01A]MDX3850733.1 2-dehydropantoate 2-reductase N-terminal domain-containing protein [Streptomyces sp. AK02-01A]